MFGAHRTLGPRHFYGHKFEPDKTADLGSSMETFQYLKKFRMMLKTYLRNFPMMEMILEHLNVLKISPKSEAWCSCKLCSYKKKNVPSRHLLYTPNHNSRSCRSFPSSKIKWGFLLFLFFLFFLLFLLLWKTKSTPTLTSSSLFRWVQVRLEFDNKNWLVAPNRSFHYL